MHDNDRVECLTCKNEHYYGHRIFKDMRRKDKTDQGKCPECSEIGFIIV